jgi:hypothetical protein
MGAFFFAPATRLLWKHFAARSAAILAPIGKIHGSGNALLDQSQTLPSIVAHC